MSSTGISGSDSTSVLKAFSVKQPSRVQIPVTDISKLLDDSSLSKTDSSKTDKSAKGKVPATNVAFEDQPKTTDTRKFAVALDAQTQKPILDESGGRILILVNDNKEAVLDGNGEQLFFNSDGTPLNAVPAKNEKGEFYHDASGKQVLVKIDNDGNAKYDKKGNPVLLDFQGVPIDLTAKADTTGKGAVKETAKVEPSNPNIPKNIVPALHPNGDPVIGPDGRQLRVLVKDDGTPALDKAGQPQLFDWDGKKLEPPEQAFTIKRLNWIVNKGFVNKVLVSLPQFVVKKAVASSVTAALETGVKASEALGKETLAKASGEITAKTINAVTKASGKAMGKVLTNVSKEAAKDGTAATIKALTEAGEFGKGIQAVTMQEGRALLTKESTNWFVKMGQKFNPVTTVQAVGESAKAVDKTIIKEISENGVVQGSATIAKKVGIGAAEKTLQKGMEDGAKIAVEGFIKKAIKDSAPKLASETVEKVAAEATKISLKDGSKAASKYIAEAVSKEAGIQIGTTALQKTITEAVSKGTAEAAEKGTVKVASKVSTIAPYVGAAVGVAITAWDANHAYKLTKDPKVTKLSAGLAWATVGLDAVSVAANFSAVGAPIGWVATGLSIGTSIASDIYKYKK
jgi:hypothetical protein